MSIQKPTTQDKTYSTWQVVVSILVTFFIIGLILIGAVLAMTPAGQSLGSYLRFLFALNSVQIWWYVTRASGIIAYLLLWFSTILKAGIPRDIVGEVCKNEINTAARHPLQKRQTVGFE